MDRLADLLPSEASPDDVLDAMMRWAGSRGLTLYPAQEEALLAALSGANVIVNTPTGSGKSLIALGAHAGALAAGQRTFYTAPIKALVSEKFFDLSAELGPARVGMLTGDASVNPDAPVICATAEILANIALRAGRRAPVGQVVMDEFHFYADPDRGWAWQVPLIELPQAQFLLLSATLGDVSRFEADLTRRTGRPTSVVRSAVRPIPLDYTYCRTPMQRTIEDLLAAGQAPLYVVHFTQAAALQRAQALTSINVASRAERDVLAEAIRDFRFAPGFGRTLARYVRAGIGVHHAGMLPKYRRLVERLAQDGQLKVICGTDTLGVGINVPIRTVVFTQLSKYDGSASRLLTAREFHQIAGRAGRAGYDPAGSVVVQAPEHVIENEQARAKAGEDPRKRRKVVRAKPRPGLVEWNEDTFKRLVAAPPEPLRSSFKVTHAMVLDVLDRPGNGCRALARLLTDNDEDRPAQRAHIRRAIAIYRSLLAEGALERLSEADSQGRMVRVTVALQSDFALNQPLSPFVLEALRHLDPASESFALDTLSVVESTLGNPGPILSAQLERLRTETLAQLKADGVDYEQRLEALDELEYPKPLGDLIYELFDRYRVAHPWAADDNIAPKSVARDLYERGFSFAEYVAYYGLARSEGLVLRYLSDAYKGLVQSVPEDTKTDELFDLTEWLGELVRQTDSSLLDEWEALVHPPERPAGADHRPPLSASPRPLRANPRALRIMVANELFRRVELIARRDWVGLGEADGEHGWDASRWAEELAPYFAEHDRVGIGADARSRDLLHIDEEPEDRPGEWLASQTLDDPAGFHEWELVVRVDLDESDRNGQAVIVPVALRRP